MSCKYCIEGISHPWGAHPGGCTCYGCSTSIPQGYMDGHDVTCPCKQCCPPPVYDEDDPDWPINFYDRTVDHWDDPVFEEVAEAMGEHYEVPDIDLSILTEKQRFVIECSFGLGRGELSEREIAVLMGISQPAVHKLKEKALTKLRKNWEEVKGGLSDAP